MGRRGDPEWRNRAGADLLLRHLPSLDLRGPVLVMEDSLPEVGLFLEAEGFEPVVWNRRALGGRPATPWPPAGPFGGVALRLPRSKDELAMDLNAAGSALSPGGQILLYGAKDEGIESAAGLLGNLFEAVRTVGIGGRCRVLEARRPEGPPEFKASLEVWKLGFELGYPGLEGTWVSYPGVFAHGHLDPGTRLLLDCLPPLPPGSRILDYGCGSGVIGAVAGLRCREPRLTLLDVDAVALEAARENVPGASFLLRDGVPAEEAGSQDFVLSNPPLHRGKAEDPAMVETLARDAAGLLSAEGAVVLVTQRRLSIEDSLRCRYERVSVLGENSAFRVWEGRTPLSDQAR